MMRSIPLQLPWLLQVWGVQDDCCCMGDLAFITGGEYSPAWDQSAARPLPKLKFNLVVHLSELRDMKTH